MEPAPPGDQSNPGRRHPGPARSDSKPVGPEAVREAVLESAARLFAEHGVAHVSLRDIALEADVQLPLIRRYVGRRAELVDTVLKRLNDQVAAFAEQHPLEPFEYGTDSILGRWMAVLTHFATVGATPPPDGTNPLEALAGVLERSLGADPAAARVRSAQVAAISLGWRLYEDYLIAASGLGDVELDALRIDINRVQRMIASTPWPTPSDARPKGL